LLLFINCTLYTICEDSQIRIDLVFKIKRDIEKNLRKNDYQKQIEEEHEELLSFGLARPRFAFKLRLCEGQLDLLTEQELDSLDSIAPAGTASSTRRPEMDPLV
jgi:hypothetical protein